VQGPDGTSAAPAAAWSTLGERGDRAKAKRKEDFTDVDGFANGSQVLTEKAGVRSGRTATLALSTPSS
jgi:hypothetical protein